MDQADQELRHAIGKSWPFTKRDGKLDLLVPPPEGMSTLLRLCLTLDQFPQKRDRAS